MPRMWRCKTRSGPPGKEREFKRLRWLDSPNDPLGRDGGKPREPDARTGGDGGAPDRRGRLRLRHRQAQGGAAGARRCRRQPRSPARERPRRARTAALPAHLRRRAPPGAARGTEDRRAGVDGVPGAVQSAPGRRGAQRHRHRALVAAPAPVHRVPRRLLPGRPSPLQAVLSVLPTDAVRVGARFRSSDPSLSPIEKSGRASRAALRTLLSAPGHAG